VLTLAQVVDRLKRIQADAEAFGQTWPGKDIDKNRARVNYLSGAIKEVTEQWAEELEKLT